MSRTRLAALLCGGLLLAGAGGAEAAPIIAPVGGTINTGGPGYGNLADTFNQNGLSSTYTAGVTDFDAYLATNPLHTAVFKDHEWFSESGTTARVTYDLGAAYWIDRLALWNEESSGIGLLNLSYSLNGVDFFALASFVPTDNPAIGYDDFGANPTPPYGADVLTFAATQARFVQFDMSGCGLGNDDFGACAIGEVAFAEAAVPEPGTMLLLGSGLAAMVARRRRTRS